MVQILPPVPTFGSRLAEALSGAAVNYAKNREESQTAAKDKKILEQAADESLSPAQRANLYAGLSQKKLQALSPVLSALSKAGVKEQSEDKKIELWKSVLGMDKKEPSVPQGTAPQGAQETPPVPGQPAPAVTQEKRPYPQEKVDQAFIVDKDLGKFMQSQNEAFDRSKAQRTTQELNELKFKETQKHHEAGEKLAVHETSKKYAESLSESRKRSENISKAVKSVRNALKTHKTGLTWENFFKKQFAGTFIEDLPLTAEGAIIEANIPAFLEGGRELFGQRLSDADLAVVLGKTVGLGKSNEANEALLDLAEFGAKFSIKKSELANEIIKENKGYRPIDFEARVDDEFQKRYGQEVDNEYRKSFGPKSTDVHMRAPDGRELWVPPEDVDRLLELNAQVI